MNKYSKQDLFDCMFEVSFKYMSILKNNVSVEIGLPLTKMLLDIFMMVLIDKYRITREEIHNMAAASIFDLHMFTANDKEN